MDLQGFRSSVLKQYPNISKDQLKQLDDFVSKQEASSLAEAGIPIDEIETDPTIRAIQAEQVRTGKYKSEAENIELKGASATDVNLLRNVISSAQAATKKYDPKFTGFFDSLLGGARTTFGGEE